jgi:hypothetical protein
MEKENITFTHAGTHTLTLEYYSAFKQKEMLYFYNMDEPEGRYIKQNKLGTKRQILHHFASM